jgi:hypothetical protein
MDEKLTQDIVILKKQTKMLEMKNSINQNLKHLGKHHQ